MRPRGRTAKNLSLTACSFLRCVEYHPRFCTRCLLPRSVNVPLRSFVPQAFCVPASFAMPESRHQLSPGLSATVLSCVWAEVSTSFPIRSSTASIP